MKLRRSHALSRRMPRRRAAQWRLRAVQADAEDRLTVVWARARGGARLEMELTRAEFQALAEEVRVALECLDIDRGVAQRVAACIAPSRN